MAKKKAKKTKKQAVRRKRAKKAVRKVKKVAKKKKVKKIRKVKKAKRRIKRVKKAVVKKPQKFDFSSNSIFRPKIRVIGIGGGGSSIVSEIGRSLEKASFVIADTDIRTMKKKSRIKYFHFGQELTHGLGTGMNPELAFKAAENEKEKISKLLEGQDIVILVASLGGGLGSGASPVFAELSQKTGNVTLGIFTLPFRFEGKKKAKISHSAIKKIRGSLNALIIIPNEKIFKIVDEKTSITQAFSLVNKNLIESLESLIDLIYNPGLINIDFADVRAILKGRGMMAFLNTAEASGKNRSEEMVDKILSNPLYNNNIKAEKILFNISGADNLSMVEVEKISKRISELNPRAKIIFGISKNQKSKSKIRTTLLITGPSFAPEPVKEEAKERPVKKQIKLKLKKVKKTKRINIPIIKTAMPVGVAASIDKTEKKEAIRRNAMEVKQAQELEETKRQKQEAEWEIPAFLRKMRFKA